jgi:ATP-dependent Lon protease
MASQEDESPSSSSSSEEEEENAIIYIPIDTDNELTSDDESSSSTFENDINDQSQTSDAPQLPSTRDHSYLPGIQHPLYPAEFLRHDSSTVARDWNHRIPLPNDSSSSSSSHGTMLSPSNIIELPILQLDGVVIFPETTLPLRITNHSFGQYLRREIDSARERIVSGSSFCGVAENQKRDNNIQVKIGIVTRLQHRRRSVAQDRLRRHAVINDENGGNSNQGATNQDASEAQEEPEVRVNRRMGRWNMALIRRHIIPRRRSESSASSSEDDASRLESRSSEQIDQPARPRRLRPEERSINYGRTLPTDRLKGRIGTMATIISVNETEPNVSANRNEGESSQQHIIITVMTTGRFKILSPVDGNESMEDFEWKIYNVEELNDRPLHVPSSFSRPWPWRGSMQDSNTDQDDDGDEDGGNDDDDKANSIEADIILHRRLSTLKVIASRSSLSMYSLQIIWPQKIVKDIVREIQNNCAYAGVKKILPNVRDQYNGMFSFWLSSNIPLSNDEKLDILEAHSDSERLKLLLRMIKRRNLYISCKQCLSHVAQVSDIFSLDSIVGTSGAYGK